MTEALLAPEGLTDSKVNEGVEVPWVNGEIKACEETGVRPTAAANDIFNDIVVIMMMRIMW